MRSPERAQSEHLGCAVVAAAVFVTAVVVLVVIVLMVAGCATDPEPVSTTTTTTTTVDATADERCQDAVSDVEDATTELDQVGRELAHATSSDAIADLYHRHGDLTDTVVNDLDVVMDICFHAFSVDEMFAAASVQVEALDARNEIYSACRELLAPDGFDC